MESLTSVGQTLWTLLAAPERQPRESAPPPAPVQTMKASEPRPDDASLRHEIAVRNVRIQALQAETDSLQEAYDRAVAEYASPRTAPGRKTHLRATGDRLSKLMVVKRRALTELSNQILVLEGTLVQLETSLASRSLHASVVGATMVLGDPVDGDGLLDQFHDAADDLYAHQVNSSSAGQEMLNRMFAAPDEEDTTTSSFDADVASVVAAQPRTAPRAFSEPEEESHMQFPAVPATRVRVRAADDTRRLVARLPK